MLTLRFPAAGLRRYDENQWGQTPLIFILYTKPTGWPSLETTLTLRFPAFSLHRYDKLDCFITAFLAKTCPERLMVIGSQGTINAKSPSARRVNQ